MAWCDSQTPWQFLAANTFIEWYYWLQQQLGEIGVRFSSHAIIFSLFELISVPLYKVEFYTLLRGVSLIKHVFTKCFYTATPKRTNCSSCTLPVIGDTVTSNCCRNVIFRLRHGLKLCLFLSYYCGFDLIIPSKPLTELWLRLIAPPWTMFSCSVVVLFPESNVNSACLCCPCGPDSSLT